MEHARALAGSVAKLPPIIVNRATMRVIDGMHRLRAAVIRGQHDIDVQFFDGDVRDAFVLAVKENIAHGLPLSLADRTAAAARIINSHPQWSDRTIASIAGLAAKTVGAVRHRSTEENPQLNTRIGRDGRVRPLNTAEGRRIAGELMVNRPTASLREIAREAGISLGTAQDVRERLRRGKNLVPLAERDAKRRTNQVKRDEPATQHDSMRDTRTPPIGDRASILRELRKDPSLRFAHAGRVLLRMLHALAIDTKEWQQLIDHIPVHCTPMLSNAARACADAWQEFAEQLERR
jgi:ParB-like chromosome segregation protein Spo0J